MNTGKKPIILEFLPADQTTGKINAGFGTLIMNKIEEYAKEDEIITAPRICEDLHLGKTTVIKWLKRYLEAGKLTQRMAKLKYENSVVITPVYYLKKKTRTYTKTKKLKK